MPPLQGYFNGAARQVTLSTGQTIGRLATRCLGPEMKKPHWWAARPRFEHLKLAHDKVFLDGSLDWSSSSKFLICTNQVAFMCNERTASELNTSTPKNARLTEGHGFVRFASS